MSAPKKHHDVPRFFLKGFVPPDSESDQLFVLDKSTGKQWQAGLNDAGCENHFYVLELDDEGDPFALEKALSQIESDGAEALRAVKVEKRIPRGELLTKLMGFLGLMAVRGPSVLDAIEKPLAQIFKSMLCRATDSQDSWNEVVEDLKKNGQDISDVSWEEMRRFVRSDDCTITMGQNWKMSSLLEMIPIATHLLAKRIWSVVDVPCPCGKPV